MWNPETQITELKYIGTAYVKKLNRLGIETVKDLLWHFPMRYEDFSEYSPIAEIKQGQKVSILGKIVSIKNQRTWKHRLILTNAEIEDETGVIKTIWYNQPFLIKTLKEGLNISLSGNVKLDKYGLYLQNPSYEIISQISQDSSFPRPYANGGADKIQVSRLKHTGRLVPIYPETERLSSRYLRFLIKPLLNKIGPIPEWLPSLILKKHNLPAIRKALVQIHFPNSEEETKSAKKRFAFEELFLFQLKALQERKRLKTSSASIISFNKQLIKEFVGSLPYKLTNAQRIALWEIIQDLNKPHPMNRLLNGDVGSGKTIVAAAAALEVAKTNYQVAYLAPTEILSHQHFITFKNVLKNFNLTLAVVTGSGAKVFEDGLEYEIKKPRLIERLAKGEIHIVIGTHALIQKSINFKDLALVIIDEQHRFGVKQRAELLKKGYENRIPHLLSMTATPIPRTLALALYGDLDLSVLNEMPKGRQKIKTELVGINQREKAYEFIRNHIKIGRQVFVICPRIDVKRIDSNNQQPTINYQSKPLRQLSLKESETLEKKAVVTEYEKLSKNIFPDLKVAMLHGKMRPKEKGTIMQQFKNKEFDILVATSVIEVGIDIPNATVMAIEGAEYFGLAQLHQFRGRVGRGEYQSHCLLFIESPMVATTRRLSALLKYDDGFRLAEMDLKIRGPGEFLGSEQSGIPDLVMSSLTDLELIKKTRNEAKLILESGIEKYPRIEQKLTEFSQTIHLE
ncbi:MAG: ATP-dependent DNA helicase RecG [Parcubacteria group bacterium]|nr:ATP-dependent DNA helicase RecG [Parcubacteria group bacterium]